MCSFCRARLWEWEQAERRKMPCCNDGAVSIPREPWPATQAFRQFAALFKTRNCVAKARRYNALFAFTSMATTEVSLPPGGPRSFTLSGALCHVLGPLEPTTATRGFTQIYVVDPDEQLATRQGMDAARGLNANWIAFLQTSILLPLNPFATLYKFARKILAAATVMNS